MLESNNDDIEKQVLNDQTNKWPKEDMNDQEILNYFRYNQVDGLMYTIYKNNPKLYIKLYEQNQYHDSMIDVYIIQMDNIAVFQYMCNQQPDRFANSLDQIVEWKAIKCFKYYAKYYHPEICEWNLLSVSVNPFPQPNKLQQAIKQMYKAYQQQSNQFATTILLLLLVFWLIQLYTQGIQFQVYDYTLIMMTLYWFCSNVWFINQSYHPNYSKSTGQLFFPLDSVINNQFGCESIVFTQNPIISGNNDDDVCYVCNIVQDEWTHHCSQCNVCVHLYSFHSYFYNRCICSTNLLFYFMITLSQSLLILLYLFRQLYIWYYQNTYDYIDITLVLILIYNVYQIIVQFFIAINCTMITKLNYKQGNYLDNFEKYIQTIMIEAKII